jgi:hypothetical protein
MENTTSTTAAAGLKERLCFVPQYMIVLIGLLAPALPELASILVRALGDGKGALQVADRA